MVKVKISKKYMFIFFTEQITLLRSNGKLGTARNYKRTLNSFSSFLKGKDIPLSACSEELVCNYDIYLQSRRMSRNTRSFYMRVLRSVYNKAVKQNYARQTFPFSNVYTGVDNTRKRAVDEQIIIRLKQYDLSESPSLAVARNLFIFSYATRGMSFIDIAFLRKHDISDGYITYIRHKTGQKLTIHIEPCIEGIIQHYQESNSSSSYLFPFITSVDTQKAYTQYQTALGYYNRQLKKLGQLIGLKIPLSSYTSRHTWATVARNHNIPIAVISEGMGHSSERTTRIYLASLKTSIIDRANREILEALNG